MLNDARRTGQERGVNIIEFGTGSKADIIGGIAILANAVMLRPGDCHRACPVCTGRQGPLRGLPSSYRTAACPARSQLLRDCPQVNHEVRGCRGGDAQNDPPGWEGGRCTRPPSARWHVRAQRPRLPASGAAALTSPTPGLNQGNQLQTSWK